MGQTKHAEKINGRPASKKNIRRISITAAPRKTNYGQLLRQVRRSLKDAVPSAMPQALKPMLATLIREPFNDPDWLFEIKWDGYRALGYISDTGVQLRSRSNLPFHHIYGPVTDALEQWGIPAVIDGEIIVMNEEGRSDFDALQRWQTSREGQLAFYVFDILWLDGINLMQETLEKRKDILKKLVPENSLIKFSDSIGEYGVDFFQVVKSNGLEGIVAKKKNSQYEPGKRTPNWLKMPTEIRQEFVIGGWTESESNRPFRSLLFGYYEDGKLINAGHAGGGFKESEMPQILAKLRNLETLKNPFANKVETETKAHWVKPELVAEIKYATLTSGGKIRKPAIFLGFREDKQPMEVRKEVASDEPHESKKKTKHNTDTEAASESNWPVIEAQPVSSEGNFEIEGQQLRLTNIENELWRGITKARLIQYYHTVAPLMLPHCMGRPLSLHIKHRGPMAPGLYIKDMEGRRPAWAEIFSMNRKHKKKGGRDRIDYLVCNSEASLLYTVNLGCIDINPWTSKAAHPDQPDFIIIDLDPSDNDFSKVLESALAAKDLFSENKITAFPKTSGKTGMHLYLPCSGLGFPEARTIAENICLGIHALVPAITTTEVSISRRGNRLYLDPNQNDFADTVAAAYSVRPYHVPAVSTPLEWKEIRPGLDPGSFNLNTIPDRIQMKGDLFRKILDPAIASKNNKSLRRFLV